MSVDRQRLLLDHLRESQLLEPGQLDELAKLPEARDPDPKALGRVLLQRRLLTHFQINYLARGKAKDLTVGRFLLLDKLGDGGMGQVYKAKDRRMGRVVALKVMRKEKLANADSVKRFHQEVQAASQLNHPNIVIAYDFDQVGAIHYFVMEFVDGIDLSRQVKQNGPLPVALACEYVRQAALGLQHAHEKGLIHRDVKPANLLVTANGATPQVKILDMGLARVQNQGETGLTHAGQVLGTPDYLAPEQAFDSRKADVRSDVYSLGCTLYYLLTGKAPFTGETLTQVLLKHQMEEAVGVEKHRREVPPALAIVLRKLMAKQPDDRYQSATEVAEALAPFARGEKGPPVPVPHAVTFAPADDPWGSLDGDNDRLVGRPGSSRSRSSTHVLEDDEAPRRGPRSSAREKPDRTLLYVLAGGGAALFLLLVTTVLAVVLLKRPSDTSSSQGNTVTSVGGGKKARSASEEKEKGKVKPPDDPGEAWPRMDELFGALERAVREGKVARTRVVGGGAAEFYDVPADGALLVGLEVGIGKFGNSDVPHSLRPIYRTRKGRVLGPRQGPELERVVTLEAKPGYAIGALSVRAGAGLDAITATFMAIDGLKLDPSKSYQSETAGGTGGNGPYLLGGNGAPVVGLFGKLWNDRTGQLGLVTLAEEGAAPVGPQPGTPAVTGPMVKNLSGPRRTIRHVAFLPDGQRILFNDSRSLRLWDLDTGAVPRNFQLRRAGTLTGLALSKDGRLVLAGGSDRTLRLWDVDSGAERKQITGLKGRVHCVALSPDGRYAASAGGTKPSGQVEYEDTEVRLWDLDSGKEVHAFAGHTTPVFHLAFSPDGKRLLSAAHNVWQLWDVEGRRKLQGGNVPNTSTRVAFLDDRRFLVGLADGGIEVREVDGGKLLTTLRGQPRLCPFAPSRDGRRVVSGGGGIFIENNVRTQRDCVVRLWDPTTGQELGKFDTPMPTTSIALSDDGRFIATGSSDGGIRLWDATKLGSAPPQPVEGTPAADGVVKLKDAGFQMALDSKGNTLVTGNIYLQVVDTRQGKLLRDFPVGEKLNATNLVFAPDDRHVLVACNDNNIRLVDTVEQKVVRTYEGNTTWVQALDVSPDGELLVCGGGKSVPGKGWVDCDLHLWEVKTGKKLASLAGHRTMIRGARFSPDGKQLLSTDLGLELRVWKLARDKEVKASLVKTSRLGAPPWGQMGVSSDGKRILYASGPDVVLWDVAGEREAQRINPGRKSMVRDVVFAGSDRYALVGYTGMKDVSAPGATRKVFVPDDVTVRLWNLETAQEVKSFTGHARDIMKVRCSPDGRRGYSTSIDNELRIWDLPAPGAVVKTTPDKSKPDPMTPAEGPQFIGHEGEVNSILFTPGGKQLVSGGEDRTIRVWDFATGKEDTTKFPQSFAPIRGIALSSDGLFFVACTDRGANVYKFKTRESITSIGFGKERTVGNCAFLAGGPDCAFAVGDKIDLWHLNPIRYTRGSPRVRDTVRCVAASPDKAVVASGDADGVVQVYNAETLKGSALLFPHKGDVFALAFQPKGFRVVSGGADKLLMVRDYRAGGRTRKISGHNGPIYTVAFSPDGRYIVSGSKDTTVRLWEAATGRPIKTYTGHKGPVRGVVFDPAGKSIVSCGDGIRVWPLPPGVVIKTGQ
jgi:WD40 repeat protein/serine/threonine protein kinase